MATKGDVIPILIVTNKSDRLIINLATKYGSTSNVIPLEAKKGFCFSIGYVNNLWLLCLYIIIKVSIIIRSLYVPPNMALFY